MYMSLISNVIELRLGKVEARDDSLTAINKYQVKQSVINDLGMVDDEQAESFHGGQDRALLQYNTQHYQTLAQRFPQSSALFVKGGFGENLVVEGMSETNICIGDLIRIGSCLLEVSQPRSPCFKLNTRFKENNLARFIQENQQTGWFYRVVESGQITDTDAIYLVSRPHPEWTLAKVLHHLYIDTNDQEATQALANLVPLANETKDVFITRLNTHTVEDWSGRLDEDALRQEVEVVAIETVTNDEANDDKQEVAAIKRFSLKPTHEGVLSNADAGSHIMLELSNGQSRAYSLCSPISKNQSLSATRMHTYDIAVQAAKNSKGGSFFMHTSLKVGDKINIKAPANYFPMTRGAHHIFIAAGIGITPFLAMIKEAELHNETYELHYCVPNTQHYAFQTRLLSYADNLSLYSPDNRLDLNSLLLNHHHLDHVYTCGGSGFVNQVRDCAQHWPENAVHFEHFSSNQSHNKAFQVTLNGKNKTLTVQPQTSLLEALREQGFAIESHCETGICGKCQISYDGEVEHKDAVLSQAQKKHLMTPCVSRAKGEQLTVFLEH
jgi:MOSC domain-containing protein YiiM/ferredoxin-NADP reductase